MPIELQCEISMPPQLQDLASLLASVAESCFCQEGIEKAGFCIRIVDDAAIQQLNREMRNIDQPTDVLSFPSIHFPAGKTARDCPKRLRREYDPYCGYVNLGDCVINLNRAQAQAAEYGHSLARELGYLTAHSAFHLMGYDHMNEEDRANMRAMEERALNAIGLSRNESEWSDEQLFNLACEAMENAYAPYSHFKVGACILTEDGRIFKGCNFENASYGATICAERCAAACAITAGARRFKAIAVVGSSAVAWPCGVCRQVLREFSDPSLRIIVGQHGGNFVVKPLSELLPHSLSPEDLGVQV